jgi:prepilin-type N-terminal cleavage/methylation domain-containing protein
MKHFKNSHTGFSFIEMMVALTLLATFGTSLFLVQTNIFAKILSTHRMVIQSNDIDQELVQFQIKVQQAIIQKKSPEKITINIKKQHPDRTISIKMKEIAQGSSLHKIFAKYVRIVQITIVQDQYQNDWYSFMYIPPISSQEASSKTEASGTETSEEEAPETPKGAA